MSDAERDEDVDEQEGAAQAFFKPLQKMDVPSEFALYPRSSHGITEPWLAADAQERTRQWFVHWHIERQKPRADK